MTKLKGQWIAAMMTVNFQIFWPRNGSVRDREWLRQLRKMHAIQMSLGAPAGYSQPRSWPIQTIGVL
jgi:hypothetical protein